MACTCVCTARKVVWVVWGINLFFSVVYMGLAITSYWNLKQGVDRWNDDSSSVQAYKNGLLASCILGFLIVFFWNAFSLIVLISRVFSEAKLAYGMMLGSALYTAWFQLLAGLVLNAAKNLAQNFRNANLWSENALSSYQATFAFSYILVASYIITCVVMYWFRESMGKSAAYSPGAGPTPPPAAPAKPGAHLDAYTEMRGSAV